MNVVHAMAGDAQVVGFGQGCDLHPGGDAATVGDIGLRERHAADTDHPLELIDRVEVLARCNRGRGHGGQAGMADLIVRDHRLFQPG